MKTNSELIVDEAGLEILVSYRYQRDGSQMEEGHGYHDVGGGIEVDLTAVEVIIKGGNSVDILPFLNGWQQDYIIDKLNFDE